MTRKDSLYVNHLVRLRGECNNRNNRRKRTIHKRTYTVRTWVDGTPSPQRMRSDFGSHIWKTDSSGADRAQRCETGRDIFSWISDIKCLLCAPNVPQSCNPWHAMCLLCVRNLSLFSLYLIVLCMWQLTILFLHSSFKFDFPWSETSSTHLPKYSKEQQIDQQINLVKQIQTYLSSQVPGPWTCKQLP